MTIISVNVTEFKAHCLDMIRQVEKAGTAVDLVRHGKVVARLVPTSATSRGTPAWLRLRGCGLLDVAPDESVLNNDAFDALSMR